MNLEEAHDLIDTADEESEGIDCDFCPFTSEVGCTTEASCSGVTVQATRLIIAAKDARIAELEKQNAELRTENERLRFEHCGCYNCANQSDQGWGCILNKQKECTDNNFYYWESKRG